MDSITTDGSSTDTVTALRVAPASRNAVPPSDGAQAKSANREVRKLLARSYLREMRAREALSVYLGVLRDAPDDTDVLTVLGNLYWLAGSACEAMWLYQLVLQLQPANIVARRAVLEIDEPGAPDWAATNPMTDLAIEALAGQLERLTGAETLEKIRAAADHIGKIAIDEQGGVSCETARQLMPALIELNIREARASGHAELAEALQSLQNNLACQLEDRWAEALQSEDAPHD